MLFGLLGAENDLFLSVYGLGKHSLGRGSALYGMRRDGDYVRNIEGLLLL